MAEQMRLERRAAEPLLVLIDPGRKVRSLIDSDSIRLANGRVLIGADHGAPAHVVLLDANDEVIFRVHRQLSSMHTVPSIGDNVLQNTGNTQVFIGVAEDFGGTTIALLQLSPLLIVNN